MQVERRQKCRDSVPPRPQSSIIVWPTRPTNHPTLVIQLSLISRRVSSPLPLTSANSSRTRSQPRTVSSPNMPACLLTTSSTCSTHNFHSPSSRERIKGTRVACVRDGCARICEVRDCKKRNVSVGGHLSRRGGCGVSEE
jgi:hypothetical protein